MGLRILNLRVPQPLVEAIVDLAFAEDRTPAAQAERLLREALTQHGRWPPEGEPNRADRELPADPEHSRAASRAS